MANKYEYAFPQKLEGVSRYFIKVPESIIYDDEAGDKLLTVFSFFSVRKGLDDRTMFTVNKMVEWSGKKPNRHVGSINSRFKDAIRYLDENEYISVDCDSSNISDSKCYSAKMNMNKIHDECDDYDFAVIYIDELEKILGWKSQNPKDTFSNNDIVLRTFAYIRMIIKRRSNKMPNDEVDVEKRKAKWPEAWNGYYKDMAEVLNIPDKAMSNAVDILCKLGLVYKETLDRRKYDGKWFTQQTIFCNAYKREGQYLLASGEEYYKDEIKNKKKILNIAD